MSKNKIETKKLTTISSQTLSIKSPIPPAIEIERLYNVNPDYADRVIRLAEDNQEKRFSLENSIVDKSHSFRELELKHNVRILKNGQFISVIVASVLGYPKLGYVIAGTGGATTIVGYLLKKISKPETKKESSDDISK